MIDSKTKRIYDGLTNAEWLEQVMHVESKEQAGVFEEQLTFMKINSLSQYSEFKIIIFSKLYRELAKQGLTSQIDLAQIALLGQGFAIQKGFEKPPR